MNVAFNKEGRCVCVQRERQSEGHRTDGETERKIEHNTQKTDRKKNNETGSITQTSQLDIKGNEDRGCGCPLRGENEFNFPQWPSLKEITIFLCRD